MNLVPLGLSYLTSYLFPSSIHLSAKFTFLYSWVIFNCIYVLSFCDPFICWSYPFIYVDFINSNIIKNVFANVTFKLLVSSLVRASEQPSVLLCHVHLHEAVRAELIEAITVIYFTWVNFHVLYTFAQDGLHNHVSWRGTCNHGHINS